MEASPRTVTRHDAECELTGKCFLRVRGEALHPVDASIRYATHLAPICRTAHNPAPGHSEVHDAVILTEEGLRFRREGDHWRCVEHPQILRLADRRHVIEGRPEFYATARQALDVVTGRPLIPRKPAKSRRPRR